MLLLIVSDLNATLQKIRERGPSGGEVVEDPGLLIEDNVEVPASANRTDGGFDAKTLSGNDLDPDGSVRALRVGSGNFRSIELLVGRVNHFMLYGELAVSWKTSGVVHTCLGRSTQSCRPTGSGLPSSWTGISAWITGDGGKGP